jgi:hypothetical protein
MCSEVPAAAVLLTSTAAAIDEMGWAFAGDDSNLDLSGPSA